MRKEASQLLEDPALAERVGDARYWARGAKCDSCAARDPVFYVATPGTCIDCLAAAWRQSFGADHPRGRRACLIAGLRYWVDAIPRLCARGPHGLKHDTETDRCITCEEQRRQARAERRVADRAARVDARFKDTPAPKMDRKAARELGFVRFTGEPCVRGHDGVRYVSTGGCIKCLKGF